MIDVTQGDRRERRRRALRDRNPTLLRSRSVRHAFTVSLALLVCCSREDNRPPFDIAVMTRQLAVAGYTVTTSPIPDGLARASKMPGVTSVDCIDAKQSGTTDTFCVIRCATSPACSDVLGNTGESYGDWQRGPSVIVHEMCAKPPASLAGFDCVTARRAIGQ